MDAYIVFFALVGLSMCLLGLNMIATIVTMRAPGLTWSRLPIFCWGVISTAVLMLLAAPVLIAVLGMAMLDRTAQTSFFIPSAGGSPYLYENLFWVFGHPEVYVLALPGFAIVLELLPVFTRKPLWGYRLAVSGMLGVTLLSWLVWQHHLFVSGINSDLRPFYMLSTELISIPTGFTFICGLMTLWRGQIRFAVPMLFCLAWFFNFLVGGLSGVFLSDVPSDVTTHGSFFSMAHFHYTIMGGLVFTFFAAIYYWVPKMTGLELNERLGKIHFWMMFISFNSTFAPLFADRLPRAAAPLRHVPVEPAVLERLGIGLRVRAGAVDAGLPLQLRLLARLRAQAGRSEPVAFALAGVAAAVTGARPQLRPDPGDHGRPVRLRLGSAAAARNPDAGRGSDMTELAQHGTDYAVVEGEPADLLGRNLNAAAHLLASASAFFFLAFVFAYFYLRSLDNGEQWHPKHVDPSQALGVVIIATVVASAVVVRLALVDQRAGRAAAWRLKAGSASCSALRP